jgi:hypothetical protein
MMIMRLTRAVLPGRLSRSLCVLAIAVAGLTCGVLPAHGPGGAASALAAVPRRQDGPTSVETEAVNWAIGQIGSKSYDGLCLTLVTDAYQTGAGFNIESLTNYGTFNASTYPQEVWNDGFKSGVTGGSNTTPPYGALVFYNASGPGASDPSDYSHVTIMGSNGEMISSPDVVNESAVHYETMAQVAAAHPWNTYVGWWLPDGTAASRNSAGVVDKDGAFYTSAVGQPWTLIVSHGDKPTAVSVSGSAAAVIDKDGAFYTSAVGKPWILLVSAADKPTAIAVFGTAVGVIDKDGAFYTPAVGQPWTTLVSHSDKPTAISVSGSSVGVIDEDGAFYTTAVGQPWSLLVSHGDAPTAIAVSGSAAGVVDRDGAFYTPSVGQPWTLIVSHGDKPTAISVSGTAAAVIDKDGAFYTRAVGQPWTSLVSAADEPTRISVGD